MARNCIYIFIIAFIFNVFCIQAYEYEYEGRLIRNPRQRERSNSKPPRFPVELERELEDSYGEIITSRPKYYEGGNQWKPMYEQYDQPPQRPPTKYRSKPSHSPKYQQEHIYPPDFYPKRPSTQEYSSTNFIANQTLYVTDDVRPSKPVQKKIKHSETNSKKRIPPPQYQVHEDVEDNDEQYYEGSQNQFRHQDIVVGKPKQLSQYASYPIIKEKHIHHVHYPNGDEEILPESSSSIYRYPSKIERRPYTRNSRYSSSYSSKRPY